MKTLHETAFGAAFARAGGNANSLRLRSIAVEAMRATHNNADRARALFVRHVKAEHDLLHEVLRVYFESCIDPPLHDNRSMGIDAGMGAGHGLVDNQSPSAGPNNLSGEGRYQSDDRALPALPTAGKRTAAVPPVSATLYGIARPVREPTAANVGAAARVRQQNAITVLDTVKIGGIAVGDWTVAAARREGRQKTFDGYILRTAAGIVSNADPSAKLREIVKVSEMQAILQKAAEAADAA